MHFDWKQSARVVTAVVLVTIFAVPQSLLAQATNHLVSPSDLHQAAIAATQARQQNIAKVREFFSSNQAQQAMKSARIDAEQVKGAVARLDDAELAQLASRVQKIQADFAAGNFSDRDLILIILAVVALVLIIVAVR
jgi:alcohol dehydrogenase YqhD (iron-dependent ADH family)